MGISCIEPSSLIIILTKYSKRLKSDAKIMPKKFKPNGMVLLTNTVWINVKHGHFLCSQTFFIHSCLGCDQYSRVDPQEKITLQISPILLMQE